MTWREGIVRRVRAAGFGSVSELLEAHPAEPYVSVAKRLQGRVAPVQLIRLQMEEARGRGQLRQAAMDALVRELGRHLPGGWGRGERLDFRTASAYAAWCTDLSVEAGITGAERLADAVWERLKALGPPDGWSPSDGADPLIVRAFADAWPPSTSVT